MKNSTLMTVKINVFFFVSIKKKEILSDFIVFDYEMLSNLCETEGLRKVLSLSLFYFQFLHHLVTKVVRHIFLSWNLCDIQMLLFMHMVCNLYLLSCCNNSQTFESHAWRGKREETPPRSRNQSTTVSEEDLWSYFVLTVEHPASGEFRVKCHTASNWWMKCGNVNHYRHFTIADSNSL